VTSPLDGYTVVVTRPAAQAGRFVALVEATGARCLALPTLAIEPRPLPAARVAEVLGAAWDWSVYTSTNAVEFAAAALGRLPEARRTAAVGRATAHALERRGVTIDVRPESANSEGLLAAAEFVDLQRQTLLLVKGEGGRDLLRETLLERGARVDVLEVYRRVAARLGDEEVSALRAALESAPSRVITTVTSVEVLEGLLRLLPDPIVRVLRATSLVVPGPRVAAAAAARQWAGPVAQAATAEDAAMLDALRSLVQGAQPTA
jgi:uroporphyrinogen-III synthase